MYRDLKIGDIVRHFKYETLSIEDKKLNKYLYCIKDFAEHTETKESMVVYQALYSPFKVYVRPAEMFFSKVDTDKYPDIKQEFRFCKHSLK